MWIPVLGRCGLRSLAVRSPLLSGGAGLLPKPAGVPEAGGRRWMCSKPEDAPSKAAGAHYKVPGHKPTSFEKRVLVWAGRFKKQEDIPEVISYDMVDAAKSKVRVKVATLMMVLTVFGCIFMVVSGKRAAARHESLATRNLEKKARLREEALKEGAKPE